MSGHLSPNIGAPWVGKPNTLQELLVENPAEFSRYMRIAQDTNFDYRDAKERKKHPSTSGIRGMSW
jgi:hypothetical protein